MPKLQYMCVSLSLQGATTVFPPLFASLCLLSTKHTFSCLAPKYTEQSISEIFYCLCVTQCSVYHDLSLFFPSACPGHALRPPLPGSSSAFVSRATVGNQGWKWIKRKSFVQDVVLYRSRTSLALPCARLYLQRWEIEMEEGGRRRRVMEQWPGCSLIAPCRGTAAQWSEKTCDISF